jgi:HK97 family phage major capsid protein
MNALVHRSKGLGDPLTGVEAEVHQHIATRARESGIQPRNGIFLPMSMGHDLEREHRTMSSTGAGKGAETVFDAPGQLIEFLRNRAVIFRMGAKLLSDLVGPVPFPRQLGDVTVLWTGENPAAGVAASDVPTGQVTLSPKTMKGHVRATRQWLAQTSLDAENMLRDSFGFGHGLAFDRAALVGKGAENEPTGIYFAPDVLPVAMGGVVPTWTKITEMMGALSEANADFGSIGFVSTPTMAARLKATPKITGAAAGFIWDGTLQDGSIDGYEAMASGQMPKTLGVASDEHGFVFGNWADMVAGTWGGVELTIDPFTLADSDIVRFISWQMGDVILRHPQSFVKGTAAKLA